MALLADYASLDELRAFLRITDAGDDPELSVALTAASRAIDHATSRHFGVDDSAVARYYSPLSGSFQRDWGDRATLEVDDISTTTGLVVKSDTAGTGSFATTLVLNTDYRLFPYNAALEGRPWTRIILSQGVGWAQAERGVEVTARWGWPAVPSAIKQATLVQASRFVKRRDAPFGVAGSPEMGNELRLLARLDPDVAVLVAGYVRHWAFA